MNSLYRLCICTSALMLALFFIGLLVPGMAHAQAPVAVVLTQRAVSADGRVTSVVDAGEVRPGDTVEYAAVYANTGAHPLSVAATLPVPVHMVYVAESARSDGPGYTHAVATDAKEYGKEPLTKTHVDARGVVVEANIPYEAYRYVRWDIGSLAPGSSVEVRMRATVAQSDLAPESSTSPAQP